MATYVEFNIDQGQTFGTTINLLLDTTNADIDLSGYNVKSFLKTSYYTKNVSETFHCSISDPTNGTVDISMPSSNTSNLKPGRYVFDMFTISPPPANTATKVVEGLVVINPSVTKIP
jgi:hypothetical protein